MPYTIGVDFGTLSARAVLVRVTDGAVIGDCEAIYAHGVMEHALPDGTPLRPDAALQHPGDYQEALTASVKGLLRKTGTAPSDVIGFGLDFTASTVLPVDEKGLPLCFDPAYSSRQDAWVKLWKHHGAEAEARRMTAAAQERGEEWLAGYGGRISAEWQFPKLLETLHHDPEVYAHTHRFIEAGEWLTGLLTGTEVHSACMAGFKCLWSKENGYPSDGYFTAIDPDWSSPIGNKVSTHILPSGTLAGRLSAHGHELTGLPEGIAVSVPVIDAHAACPAANVTAPGKMLLILGTSSVHILLGDGMKAVPGICGAVSDGVIPGLVSYEAGQCAFGDLFSWYMKSCLPYSYGKAAEEEGVSPFTYMDRKASLIRPSASSPVALDWWNGNRCPYADFSLTGAIHGLKLSTKPEEIYRALLESAAFGTRSILDLFEKRGFTIDTFIAVGGIPRKNSLLMQIFADVLGRPVEVPALTLAGSLGSAIYAAFAAGIYPDLSSAAEAMSPKEKQIYRPIPENVSVYDMLYARYEALSRSVYFEHKGEYPHV